MVFSPNSAPPPGHILFILAFYRNFVNRLVNKNKKHSIEQSNKRQ